MEGTTQDRRSGERRESDRGGPAGRREADRPTQRRDNVVAVAWALVGAVVVLYLFFLAVNAIDPKRAPAVSIVVLVLAVVWVAHAWQRLYAGGHVSRPDRERRGY